MIVSGSVSCEAWDTEVRCGSTDDLHVDDWCSARVGLWRGRHALCPCGPEPVASERDTAATAIYVGG